MKHRSIVAASGQDLVIHSILRTCLSALSLIFSAPSCMGAKTAALRGPLQLWHCAHSCGSRPIDSCVMRVMGTVAGNGLHQAPAAEMVATSSTMVPLRAMELLLAPLMQRMS